MGGVQEKAGAGVRTSREGEEEEELKRLKKCKTWGCGIFLMDLHYSCLPQVPCLRMLYMQCTKRHLRVYILEESLSVVMFFCLPCRLIEQNLNARVAYIIMINL